MDAVFKEYGQYILSAIVVAFIIFCVTGVLGFFNSNTPDGSGNGLVGKLICLWLNRTM
jgi:FtsH-binding integral membrane protein